MTIQNPDGSPLVERRLGTFSMPIDWVEGMANKHAVVVFGAFRILRAELDYASNSMQYVAASEYFDPCPVGQHPGAYAISIDPPAKEGDPVTIRAKRVG